MTLMAQGKGGGIRDLLGNIIKPGLVRKRFELNPTTSDTLPSWATVNAGVVTVSTFPGVPGVLLRGIPGTTTNGELNVGPPVQRNYKLVASSVRAIGVDSMGPEGENTLALHLRDMDAAEGQWSGYILDTTAVDHTTSPYDSNSGATRIRANHRGSSASTRSVHRYPMQKLYNAADIGLFVSWENYTAYAMEGKDVVAVLPAEGLIPKYDSSINIQARVSGRAPGNTSPAAQLRIARIVVDHWYF